MSAGPGAPGDRPHGDEPLGGEAKKLKDKQVAVVIPGLSMEELLKYGVLPVILPPGMLKKNWLPEKILHTLAANLTAHPEKMDCRIVSGIVLSRKRLDRRSGHQFNLISWTLILMIRQAGRRQMTLQSSTMTPSKILHPGSRHHPVTHLCLLVHLLIRKTKSLHLVPLNLRVKITLLLVSTNFSRLN